MQIKVLLPLLFFGFISFLLWHGLQQNPHEITSPLIGKPVPQFSAVSLQNAKQTITAQDFKGHVTVLNVFATWCVTCEVEHPVLIDMQTHEKIRFYGLNYKDRRAAALHWLQQRGNPYTKIIYDPTGKIGMEFGVYGTPETFIIDATGLVRDKIVGAVSPEQWRDKVLPEIRLLQRG